jgi:hypothetical protein
MEEKEFKLNLNDQARILWLEASFAMPHWIASRIADSPSYSTMVLIDVTCEDHDIWLRQSLSRIVLRATAMLAATPHLTMKV